MKRQVTNALFFMMLVNCIVSAPLFAQEKGIPSERLSGGQAPNDTPIDTSDQSGKKKLKPAWIAASWNTASDLSPDKPIKIVYPVVMPPYTFIDNKGEAQGLSIDLLRLWSKKTGIPIRFTSASWNQTLQIIREGKADLHASLYYSEERDTYLDYATIVVSSVGSIFSHKSILMLSSPDDLKAFKVGAVHGSYHEAYLQKNLPGGSLIAYPEWPEMVRAAQRGDIKVFVEDVGSTLYRLRERGLVDEFRFNPSRPLYRNNFWVAAREGEKALAEALRQGMALITTEERAAIEHKWLPISIVKTRDALFIAMYSDFAPFTFINAQGQPAGLFIDIWRLWAEKTGKKIEFLPGNWKDSIDSLKQGITDIHSGLFYSDERTDFLDFSRPFYEAGSCFFYPAKQNISYKKGLYPGKKIGVIKGSYHEGYLKKKHSIADVIPFTSVEKMLRAVLNGEITSCLTEYSSAKALINRLGLSGMFNTDDQMHFTQNVHAGVIKGSKELLSLVNEGFAAMTTKELAEIERRWVADPEKLYFGSAAKRVHLTDSEIAWLKAHPDIVLGYTDAFEPEVIVNPDGTCRGIQVDILAELNTRLGTRIRLQIDPVPKLVEKAQKREVDGILSIHPAYADKLGLLKTGSYLTNYPAVFARKDVEFGSTSDFIGKRIAVIDKVFFSEQLVAQYGKGATILKVKDAKEGLRFIDNGQADYFLGATLNAYLITKYQLFDLANQYVFFDNQIDAVIGTRSDWPELSAILDKGLSSFSKEEIEAIVAKWIHIPEHRQATVELMPEEQAWLAQKHTVRVRAVDFPPYIFIEEDKITGIAIDYLKLIARRTGATFEFFPETRPWQEALDSLMNLKGPDLVTSISPMAEREPYMDFSKPYSVSPRMIFTQANAEIISNINDLNSRTLAVPHGTLVHKRIKAEYPDIGLLLYDTDAESIEAVSNGIAYAYIGNLVNTSYMILHRGFTNVKAAAPSPFGDDVYTFGIRRDWPELSSIINKALDTMTPAESAAIRAKHLAVRYEHGISPADVLNWGLIVFGSVVLIILVFVAWNFSLNRKVKIRTFELSESEERFRATFEQAAVGIAHVSPEGRFLRINQKFCDIAGYSFQEMLTLTFQEITHPDDLDRDVEQVNGLLRGEAETYSMEKRYICKNGDNVWVNLTVSLIRKENGEPGWFVAVIEDITIRKEAEEALRESEEKFRHLMEQSPFSIQVCSPDGRVIQVNPAFLELWGITEETLTEIYEKYNILEDEQVGKLGIMPLLKRAYSGETISLPPFEYNPLETFENLNFTRPEGRKRWIRTQLYPIRGLSGEVLNIIHIEEDITERKQSEHKLHEYQQRLKALVSQLTLAEERERRRIAADLHDHVGQSLALSRMQLAMAIKTDSRDKMNTLLKEISDSMLQAVQDTRSAIYDLSPPQMNEIGLKSAISEWLDQQIEKKHGLKTELVADDHKLAISDDLRAVLFRNIRELITNVVKHAGAQTVSVFIEDKGDYVKIIIQDDGAGFDVNRAFGTMEKDAGFGLFSIRERMADLGGSMEIDSEPGKGCSVILTAPVLTDI